MILYLFQTALIHIGLETVFAMIRLTPRSVIMMVGTAVSTSTLITVLNALVTMKIIVFLDILLLWLVMGFVMMRPTMKTVIMMEETAVDMIPTLIFALIVNAMSMRLV